jgi:hypothetical protein
VGQAWREKENHKRFWWRILKEKNNLENLGVDGRLILIFILKKKEGITRPGQEQWLNVVNMVMKQYGVLLD